MTAACGPHLRVTTAADCRPWLAARPRDAHKGRFGHVLVIELCPARGVLTPHPSEMGRLFGVSTAEELRASGGRLAAELPRFTILVLVGELGAGKTTFMQGLAATGTWPARRRWPARPTP